mgnify:CR=1 FL=1
MIVAAAEILGEKSFSDVINKKMIFWQNYAHAMLISRKRHRPPHPASKNKKEAKGKKQTEKRRMKMNLTGQNRRRNGSTDKFVIHEISMYSNGLETATR